MRVRSITLSVGLLVAATLWGCKASREVDPNTTPDASASSAASAPRKIPDWMREEPTPVAMQTLGKKIDVAFHDTRLDDAIALIREKTGANIVVNWRALEGAGIEPGTRVNGLRLTGVTGNRVIEMVLDQVGGDLVPLGHTFCDDEVVTISTIENLGTRTQVRTYDLRPLLTGGWDYGGPQLHPRREREGLFEEAEPFTRDEMITQIMDLVRENVDPDGWRQAGGLVSSMSEVDGLLIVNTHCAHHRSIARMLRMLAENQPRRVSIQAHAVALPLADAQRLIERSAGGGTVIDAQRLRDVADALLVPGDRRTPIAGARLIVFNGWRNYASDRAFRTHVPDAPPVTLRQDINITTPGVDERVPGKPAGDRAGTDAAAQKPVQVHVEPPTLPQRPDPSSIPFGGFVLDVRPTIDMTGVQIALEIRVEHAVPMSRPNGAAAVGTDVPDHHRREVRSNARVPDGGGVLVSMPDADEGREILVLIRADIMD